MKICVLAYGRIKTSKRFYLQLNEELKKKFDTVFFGYIEDVHLEVKTGEVKAYLKGRDFTQFDAILPRFGPSYAGFGYLVLKALEGKVYFPNKPESYLTANNKYTTLMKLVSSREVIIPKTYLCCSRELAKDLAKEMGGEIVIKQASGKSGGKGVVYSKGIKTTKSILDALPHGSGEPIFLEEYLENPGEDVRLYVIGDSVAACAKRVSMKDDIRSNLHSGGKYTTFASSQALQEMAVKSAKAIGADICGVDVVFSKKKPYLIEINMNPGFAISEIAGVNLFGKVVDFMEENTRRFLKARDIEVNVTDFLNAVRDGFLSIFEKK